MNYPLHLLSSPRGALMAAMLSPALALAQSAVPPVSLANQPVFSSAPVAGNLALALSVEFPTAVRQAHTTAYSANSTFLGYFDPYKCYRYVLDATPNNSGTGDSSYFRPVGKNNTRTCSGEWSGNFLNWAATPAIDPFRWAMTGGRRVKDTPTETILEKNWQSNQGLFADRDLPANLVAGATPFSRTFALKLRIDGMGYRMRFVHGTLFSPLALPYANVSLAGVTFDATMRVKVCDSSAAAGGVESNCKQYGNNWKPEGLLQKYSQDMRYSAFGYLNDDSPTRDAGVMRARQKFIAPTQPVPGLNNIANQHREWDPATGVFTSNPDAADAAATNAAYGFNSVNNILGVSNSGVINYLNNFGQTFPGKYKSIDPVSELYYSVMRYYRNLGNVNAWSDISAATDPITKSKYLDGFPVITQWDDPIQYSCQRNFILGIGDINTHRDKNVPGNLVTRGEPLRPSAVSSDSTVNARTATNKVGSLQGVSLEVPDADTGWSGRFNSPYIAGLAYDANTKDIRPDDARQLKTKGKQTVQTYWVDVLETPFAPNNQFYLAAKYGGMKVPANFDTYGFSGTIPLSWWSTSGEKVGAQDRPDNYFTAGQPDTMVAGLERAFENIVGEIKAYTTSFSLPDNKINESEVSYAAQYDSATWSGEIVGKKLTIDSNGVLVPDTTPAWSTATRFETQLDNNGWDAGRRIATWNPDAASGAGAGVAFRINAISARQKTSLNTSYVNGDDSADYLKWLRGDTTKEAGGYRMRSVMLSTGIKRNRLGDIVNSKITVSGAPAGKYSESQNLGYSAFKEAKKSRKTMLYVGANDGMMHAFNGGLGADAGKEAFAYIPSTLFDRDTADSSALTNDGLLAQLGKPSYAHRNFVDSTPLVFDIDFNNSGGAFATVKNRQGTISSDWRSVLIGGLGKGGRSYYAIDVTNPGDLTSEAQVAGKVLWEFPARNKLPAASGGTCTADCIDMGYSFGSPLVVKTVKYGWVVILSSGYNNVDGKGHLFIVHPKTGQLLEDISTGTVASSGMAHPSAYVYDFSDMTADSVYAGDLDGQVWRFDLTQPKGSTGTYPAPVKMAVLTDPDRNVQPVTIAPLIEIHPATRKRYVLLGTGRLLDSNDSASTQIQTYYALIDGAIGTFGALGNDGVAFPITRDRLAVVDPAAAIPATLAQINATAGWRVDLGRTGSVGWRVVSPAATVSGTLAFASLLPTGETCTPSGSSRVYPLDFSTGKSIMADNSGFFSVGGVITDLQFVKVDGKMRLIAGDNVGDVHDINVNLPSPVRRPLSWREISVIN